MKWYPCGHLVIAEVIEWLIQFGYLQESIAQNGLLGRGFGVCRWTGL
jgi:hypothetical protein